MNFLTCDDCDIAYLAQPGRAPTVVFLGGFNSHMRGTKAEAIAEYCRGSGNAYARLDYSGHGQSTGRFEDATVGGWTSQALAVIDAATRGPLLLVGSSMGAWIMLLVAIARRDRVAAMIGIAAAVDMTERLIRPKLDDRQRRELRDSGTTRLTSEYDPQGYPIGQALLTDGHSHLLLHAPIPIAAPLRLLHGSADRDVPWQLSLEVMQRVASNDASLQLVKDADHRFSSPE
ncbi:MAG: alpha/beta hydrolase, partial [Gammaproteobacteria bacterium]|nr:alpha/beta hydrolase [Gammaproteobacteria bacterium]